MAANNFILFNAALNGFIGGAQSGRVLTDAVASDYAALVTAGVAFATKLDSIIANDSTISATTGTTGSALAPTTGAIADAQASKSQLIGTLARSVLSGRYSTDAIQADYSVTATACAALYAQTIASFQ